MDECAGVDALVTNRVWTAMGLDPATTLHDLRWGEHPGDGVDDFVWVFEISGAVPPSHLVGGYAGAVSERQPPMYFRLGGGTLKGVSKPGEIVWSRVFVMDGALHADLGRATVVELPREETERRWQATTPQWPIMHAVLHGVTRDQMMARHKANHIQVAYAPDGASGRPGAGRQGRDVRRDGHRRASVRRGRSRPRSLTCGSGGGRPLLDFPVLLGEEGVEVEPLGVPLARGATEQVALAGGDAELADDRELLARLDPLGDDRALHRAASSGSARSTPCDGSWRIARPGRATGRP